jgi:hypothetical protein
MTNEVFELLYGRHLALVPSARNNEVPFQQRIDLRCAGRQRSGLCNL